MAVGENQCGASNANQRDCNNQINLHCTPGNRSPLKKKLRARIAPIGPLSQNGYGDDFAPELVDPSQQASKAATQKLKKKKRANSTRRASRAVPHPSTDRAFRRLTSEFGWDRVYSTKYGRWRKQLLPAEQKSNRDLMADQKNIILILRRRWPEGR